MRLQELYIKDYKVLQDFTIRFDEQSAISVLIGENGSGKTTIVECLTLIFAELFKQNTVSDLYKATFPFSFRIRYSLSTGPQIDFAYEHEIRSAEPYVYDGELAIQFEFEDKLNVWVRADDNRIYDTRDSLSSFLQEEGFSTRQVRYLLPSNLVLYYSGISTILQEIVDNHNDKMIRGPHDGELQVSPDLFYFKPENFPALLVGLLSFRHGDIPDALQSDFQIMQGDPFSRITIQVKKPKWAKKGSETFWGATGDLANFLAVLRDRGVYKHDVKFEKDTVTFTIRTTSQLTDIWSFYGEEKSLFEHLVRYQANGFIARIDVDLRKDIQLVVPYQRLSEGEKQLLIIMALRELLAVGENSLFLFDEPDTYLHPEWKRNFIDNFQPKSLNKENFLAQYLITTHSPAFISGVRKEQLHILQRGKSPKIFSFNPYGKREDQILFDFFGVTGLRFRPVGEKLDELRSLVNEDEYDSKTFNESFQELENKIGKSDEDLIRLKLEIARRKRAN